MGAEIAMYARWRRRGSAGWPVATLRLATQSDDPRVFLYLEDVSPDGRVTYITEGLIREIHKRLVDGVRGGAAELGRAGHRFHWGLGLLGRGSAASSGAGGLGGSSRELSRYCDRAGGTRPIGIPEARCATS